MKGQTYNTIDEYIAQYPEETQEILQKVCMTIRENTLDATEKISYGMPCFWHGENLIYFAAMKNHLGIYPTADGMAAFADRLTEYKTSKGAVQFPWNRPIPYALIAEMAAYRVSAVNCKRNGK